MRLLLTTALATLVALPALAEGWKDDYKVIKFGILSGENEKDRIQRYTPFEKYLEKELGVDVEIFTAGSYDGVIQAMAADQIEFAFFGSSSYAAAYTETNGGVKPLLTRQQEDGSTGYYSIVVTRCDSGLTSLDDLKGKVHAFADPDSTSGYAVPYFNMVKQGYEPKEHFKAIPFSGSHEAGVQGVVNGTFDSASTYMTNETSGVIARMVSKGMIDEGVACPIWKSPEITSGPLAARTNLPDDLVEAMTAAVETVPEKDHNAFVEMTGGDSSTQKGWVRVDHERYQWIVDMRDWLKKQRRSS
ncbi:MAG: phosphonate ABC transporter substrate-binding protein [Pseudomonadota bacterium]|nr:phosphate ABC transporter substrate-binding protein [Rhodovulum sp. NI22]MDY6860942.1 phosphonate ABC transporter substrate-binding protein [Pseudomonadota bacterium]|tara:strand:+ start:1239 stop:2144 length:906 start_codon:yes stop_codon:yes gene_type:complete